MINPPITEASYFFPRVSPPSPTHHDANTSIAKLIGPTVLIKQLNNDKYELLNDKRAQILHYYVFEEHVFNLYSFA